MDALTLVARSGDRYDLTSAASPISVGRAPTNDIVLDHTQISRHHAQIDVGPADQATVTDLGSTNGTSLNGEPVREPRDLRPGDVLKFGSVEFEVLPTNEQMRTITASRSEEETMTVLFTDLEGHTALFEKLGTDAAYALVTQHIDIMLEEVRRSNGTVVKTEGDGLIATFASARSAVACAVAIQRRTTTIAAPSRSVPVRVGINTGDAIRDGADVLGMAVIKAARVMSHAAGGEILMAEVSRMLLGPSTELHVSAKGWFSLKGVSRRERLYAVRWRQA